MNSAPARLIAPLFFLLLAFAPRLAAQERGWGDTWTQPSSAGEREKQQMTQQIRREMSERKFGAAEKDLDALVQRSPKNAALRMWRAAAHAAMGRYEVALQDCAVALELLRADAPNAVGEAYNLRGEIDAMMGNAAAARNDFERAVREDRRNIEFNNNFAWFLATSPIATARDGQLAVRYAKAASELSQGRDPSILDTLAAAEAEAGNFDLAVKYESNALALAKGKKLRGGDQRLILFEKHQPFRESPTLAKFNAE